MERDCAHFYGGINLILGFILGRLFGGIGVIEAIAFATILGAIFIVVPYHLGHQIAFPELFPKESILLLAACITTVGVTLGINYSSLELQSTLMKMILMCLAAVFFILPSLWFHPERKTIMT